MEPIGRERNYIEIWWTQKYVFFSVGDFQRQGWKGLFREQSPCLSQFIQ